MIDALFGRLFGGGIDRPPYLTIDFKVRCVYCAEVIHEETVRTSEGVTHAVPVDTCECQTRKREEQAPGLWPHRTVTRTVRDPAPKHVDFEVTNVEVFE